MSARLTCEEARELAPELALGIISGDERAQVIAHITSCASCRTSVEKLAQTADSLLLLAPEREPAAGFESKALEQLGGPARIKRSRIWAAAAVLGTVAILSAFAVLWATADQREAGEHYEAALAEANGSYFGVKPLMSMSNGRKVGYVAVYDGKPNWAFVVFRDAPAGSYHVQADTWTGKPVDLGVFKLGERTTWGRDIPIDLKKVSALQFHGPEFLELDFPKP